MKIVLLALVGIALIANVSNAVRLEALKTKTLHASSAKRAASSSTAKSAYEQLLETVAKGDVAGLTTIIDVVQNTLIPALRTDVNTRQTQLDNLYNDFGKCSSDLSTCKTEADALAALIPAAKTAMDSAVAARDAGAGFNECSTVTFAGDTGEDEAASALTTLQNQLNAQVTTYNGLASAAASATTAYETAVENHSNKAGECPGLCTGCVTATNTAYDEAVNAAKAILPSQQEDLRTYTLIICVATESKGTNVASQLQKCRDDAASTDVSSIAYTFKDAPVTDCTGATSGGTSTTAPYPVVEDAEGIHWATILQLPWYYTPNSGAVGTVDGDPANSGFAKLSDTDINAIPASSDGYFYYKLTMKGGSGVAGDTEFLYFRVKSGQTYDDTLGAFGFGSWNQVCVNTNLAACTWVPGNHGPVIDTAPNGATGNDCRRWIIPSGYFCYEPRRFWAEGATYNHRCFSAGASCNHPYTKGQGGYGHEMRHNVVMYKQTTGVGAGVTTAAPGGTTTVTTAAPPAATKLTVVSATMSSTNAHFVAGNCIDGVTNEGFCHTLLDTPIWLELDLGTSQSISSVKIWNRADCCQNRFTTHQILVDGVKCYEGDAKGASGVTEDACKATGRKVKILYTKTDYLNLAEVEVMGSSASPGTTTVTTAAPSAGPVLRPLPEIDPRFSTASSWSTDSDGIHLKSSITGWFGPNDGAYNSAVFGEDITGDVAYEATVNLSEGVAGIGAGFNADGTEYWMCRLDARAPGWIYIIRYNNGVLKTHQISVPARTNIVVKAEIIGTTMNCYMDGVKVIDVTLPKTPNGKRVLMSAGDRDVTWSNFKW